jgi:hypothetical protein
MSNTKIKVFQSITSASPGVDLQRDPALEKEMNAFLASIPGIRIIDIKLAGSGSPVGDRVAHYALTALLIYEVAA